MSPQIEAALIAAVVSLISLGGTVAVAFRSFHATKQATVDTIVGQRDQLDQTLAAQRDQLNRTLADQHAKTLNERFATAAEKLGGDKPSAARLAGVHAMAGLADDWEDNRQTCIDVLCGYLRIPYALNPGNGQEQWQVLADREVRHTIVRIITAHLRKYAKVSWSGRDFDFTGAVLDGGDFSEARFTGGSVNFSGAKFAAGDIKFEKADFSGAHVIFDEATFCGGRTHFNEANFRGGLISFQGTHFTGGEVLFNYAKFSGGTVRFDFAEFSDGTVNFGGAEFSTGQIYFTAARFSGGTINFGFSEYTTGANFTEKCNVAFSVRFRGARVSFHGTRFEGGRVDFRSARCPFTG
jgi:uncharacterized protein YjbI with pentapeptide repeats